MCYDCVSVTWMGTSSIPTMVRGSTSKQATTTTMTRLSKRPTVPPSPEWDSLSDAEKGTVYGAYKAINETSGVTSGLQMQPPEQAVTVRVKDGKTLTSDGPFVEIKEALGGYLFFEADDLDAAIALAAQVPAARMGGAVEVRPIVAR